MVKTKRTLIITLLLVASLILSFAAGCTLGIGDFSSTDRGLEVVAEAWGIIFRDYVELERLDTEALSQAAIRGMVEELGDPYTAYVDAEAYQLSTSSLEGKFEGIGAHVGIRDGQLMIIAPIAGSPAAQAGIKAGDIILEVDGLPTADMSLQEAVLHIRGPGGTPVRLLILHQGEDKPVVIEIVRAEIKLTSVNFEMREDIAYIHITHFSERTDEELLPVLEDIAREAATGIVLDLRSNPGGLLSAVVAVAGHFLNEGVIVSTVDNQGQQTSLSAGADGLTTELPVVVLTDNYSASGSEVLAGALQDYARATIAGKGTFGKGSVNTLHRLQDGSGLYLTTARWLTPKGRLIEGEGIVPDYQLELEGEAAIQWAMDYLKSG